MISFSPLHYWLKRHIVPAWRHLLSRKVTPLSRSFGYDRGQPIDRYYIERFIAQQRDAIHGRCMEVGDDVYLRQFGTGVAQRDILDIDPYNAKATIRGDLRNLEGIADNTYDCVILTQVLQFIDDLPAAVREVRRVLKPGGVLLATLPSLSPIDTEAGGAHDYWRFTRASAGYLVFPVFGKDNAIVESCGNCRTGLAFWIGMSREELSASQLCRHDPRFATLITVKAIK